MGVGCRRAGGLEAFLEKQCSHIKENAELPKAEFLARISFYAGGYDAAPPARPRLAMPSIELEASSSSA